MMIATSCEWTSLRKLDDTNKVQFMSRMSIVCCKCSEHRLKLEFLDVILMEFLGLSPKRTLYLGIGFVLGAELIA